MVALHILSLLLFILLATGRDADRPAAEHADWQQDPVWFDGRAEWAVYDADRSIYGETRHYDATFFTAAQHMHRKTGVKIDDHEAAEAVAVFKLVISERVPTASYDYRFLRTAFLRRGGLSPFALVVSTQEDCGTSFRRFTAHDGALRARTFSYFPGAGERDETHSIEGSLTFHDALPLFLRGHPFGPGGENAPVEFLLVAPQAEPKPTPLKPAPAVLTYEGRERLDLPIGPIDADRLSVRHEEYGGVRETRVWIASEPELRRVMVRYEGPWDTRYHLRRLDRWAYWSDPPPPKK